MYVEGEVQDLFQGVSHRGGEEKSGPRLVKAGRAEETYPLFQGEVPVNQTSVLVTTKGPAEACLGAEQSKREGEGKTDSLGYYGCRAATCGSG